MGINIERTKRILFILTSLLTGLCVSLAGVIGFVGLVVPHFLRLIAGPTIASSSSPPFSRGPFFLSCPIRIARTVALPLELPVGVVTGIVGGVLFIYALTRKSRAGGA